jgi:hypothetical protein
MRTSAFVGWAVALGTALSFSLAAASSAADADGATPAVDKLVATVNSRLWICGLYARTALVHMDARRESESQSALEESLTKIRESKESFSESYVAIRTRLAGGSKESMQALNDYASSVLAAYDESAIRTGETQATYDRRTADLESELSAKAEAFRQRLTQAKAPAAPAQPLAQAAVQPAAQAAAQPSAKAPAQAPVQPAVQALAQPSEKPASKASE